MRGLVIPEIGKLKLVTDIPVPEIGPYDSLVKVDACGICNGTDMKLIEGHFKGFHTYPCVLGHESCGEVIEVGSKVISYKTGDHVLRAKNFEFDDYASGWGSFADFAIVTDYTAMFNDGRRDARPIYLAQQIVPADIDPRKAVMIITLKEVYSALRKCGVSDGMTVMINGCGPVGQTMIRFCKIMGVSRLIVSDINENRLQKAEHLGADILINPMKQDVSESIRGIAPDGLDVFIDAVGRNELINLGLTLLKSNGKVFVYGISPKLSATIDWEDAPYNWSIQFIQMPTFQEEAAVHNQVVEFVRRGAINLDDFVTHIMSVEEFEKGFELVKSRQALKVSLTF